MHLAAEAMRQDPTIEAIKINRREKSVAVATLGKADDAVIEQHLTDRLRAMVKPNEASCCALLDQGQECRTCNEAITPQQWKSLTVDCQPEATTIARITCPTAPRFWRWRKFQLPKLVPREVEIPEPDDASHEDEWKGQLVAAVVCGVLGLGGYFTGAFQLAGARSEILSLAFFIASFVAGSWYTIHEVWERLQHWTLDVHFLMLAVAFGSASIGHWGEGATLLFLFALSGALEHYALGRTHKEIRSLFRTAPKTATLLDEHGHEHSIAVADLRAGMRLIIKPGDQFPVDAEIVKGKTASDESNLTGEAVPVDKTVGDTVLAGTLNLWGVVEALALRPASQSALQGIIRLIREAQHLKAPSQRFTDYFGTRYTYGILGLCLTMFFVWWLGLGREPFVSGGDAESAFYLTMTLLVVASPCALVLSIPSAVLAAIAWAARRGILFRGGAAVENLAEVRVVAMDKTGTLTTGELMVDRIESYPPGRELEVAILAFSLEKLSTHPLARAITRYGKQRQLAPLHLEQFESVAGLGLKARQENQPVLLGRREWLLELRPDDTLRGAPPPEPGMSEVWVARDGLMGRILLRDDIRPAAREVVEQLRERGLQTVVLTGDRHTTAEKLKHDLGLDDVRGELKPEQKVEAVAAFSRAGKRVAMIGDGVNDAPSLAVADVGVAMGARGSDAALEQAEVVLMHDRLENFLAAHQLSRRASRIIRQNLFISLGTVVVLVGCALAGSIPLTVGVVGHEGSTVVVVMNSLRLLLGKQQK